MDFVVVGFGLGALAVLLGLGLRDLGPWVRRVRVGRERPPSEVARRVGWGRGCRAGGLVLALAGGAICAVTLLTLAVGVGDRAGLLVVSGTVTLAALGSAVWLYAFVRFAHPEVLSPPRRAPEPVDAIIPHEEDTLAPIAPSPSALASSEPSISDSPAPPAAAELPDTPYAADVPDPVIATDVAGEPATDGDPVLPVGDEPEQPAPDTADATVSDTSDTTETGVLDPVEHDAPSPGASEPAPPQSTDDPVPEPGVAPAPFLDPAVEDKHADRDEDAPVPLAAGRPAIDPASHR